MTMKTWLVASRRLLHDNSGMSATVLAIVFPCLIGFGALGTETGVWFTIKLRNQSAADAAAIAVAYEVIAGKTDITNDLTPAASEAAAGNGYTGAAPVVTYPYSDAVISNGVAVTLKQSQGTLLAAMFLSNVTVATKAVAVIETLNRPCVLALGTAGTDVNISASTNLSMPDCGIAANSISDTAIEIASSSMLAATSLVTAGEISVQGVPIDPTQPSPQLDLATPAMIGAPTVPDPYASILTHSYITAGMPNLTRCTPKGLGGGAVIYSGGCFVQGNALKQKSIKLTGNTQISGGLTITANQTIDLSPGTYWVSGDLVVQSNGVLKCSTCDNSRGLGVTLILTIQNNLIGTISVGSGALINLNAPSSGSFPGLLVIQDSNAVPAGTTYTSNQSVIDGAAASTLSGLLYLPNSSMTFHGYPTPAGPQCLAVVVNALAVDATSALAVGGCGQAGVALLPLVRTVALAE